MSKLRILHKYGQAPIELLNNEKVSFKAKGLFVFLQSKPDNWTFSIERISKQTKEGKDGVRSAIQELEKAGYLRRIQVIDDDTRRFIGYDYILSEKPIMEQTDDEKAVVGKADDGNVDDISNIDISKKDISNIYKEKSTKKDFVPEQESLKELENLSKSELKELIFLLNEKKKKNTTPAKKKSLSKLELKNGWQEVWNEYLEWKKTQYRFKFKTAKSEKIAFEKLFRLSGKNIQLAEKIVRQSIENTWSGLFALTQQNAKPQQQRYGDTRKDLRATGTEKRKDLR